MKRSYKVNEIARKLRKTQATVVEWSKQFADFLPTIAVGGSVRYTEEAITVFRTISKMRDANKSLKWINEHLQDMCQKAISTPSMEENLAIPEPSIVDDLNQQVSISSISSDRFVSPLEDYSESPFVQLTNEVADLRSIIKMITYKVADVIEQDDSSEVAASIDLLNVQMKSISGQVKELQNQLQESRSGLEQEIRSEIMASEELIHHKYEAISAEVSDMHGKYDSLAQKVTELMEQVSSSRIFAREELINTRFDNISVQLTSQQRLLDKLAKFLGI